MIRTIFIAGALMLGVVNMSEASQCAPRDQVLEQLGAKYGEKRHSMGLAPNNSVIEVFASEASGTWTITVTSAKGVTCLMASGQAFENIDEPITLSNDANI